LKKILFLDIETAAMLVNVFQLKQHGWIAPHNIKEQSYTMCYAAKWKGNPEIDFTTTARGHKRMLERVHSLLEEADGVVHYNGKKFDMRTLNAEFLLHGLPPMKNYPVQIDLLPLIRRTFLLPAYSLDFVCQYLGLGKKVKNPAGLWDACREARYYPKDKCWEKMERYNTHDIRLLERLYKHVRPWFRYTHGYKRLNEWLEGKRTNP